jgi:hypothetical protein
MRGLARGAGSRDKWLYSRYPDIVPLGAVGGPGYNLAADLTARKPGDPSFLFHPLVPDSAIDPISRNQEEFQCAKL